MPVNVAGAARADDGARLSFRVEGPRGGRPLLLLQGQANSQRWWQRLRGDFTDRWSTITFDYRGTGRTEADLDDGPAWSTSGFADDAAAVLRAVGADRADVYATSMGGRVAQELAIGRPAVVRRLVLACTSPGGATARERDDDVRRALADPDPTRRRTSTVDLFYTPAFVERCGGHEAVPTDLLGDTTSAVAARRHLAVSARHDAADRLGLVAAPTLVMHGTDDRMTPASNAEVVAAHVPRAELELFAGGRHGFFDELREPVVTRVRDFLGVPPRSGPRPAVEA